LTYGPRDSPSPVASPTAIFGGFTPAISFISTGNRAVAGLWLSFAPACGLLAALLARLQNAVVETGRVGNPEDVNIASKSVPKITCPDGLPIVARDAALEPFLLCCTRQREFELRENV
jgi:hypothetical protein